MKLLVGIILGLFTFINSFSAFALSAGETDQLKSPNFYKDLPVANIDVHTVDNSWATVVYLPQYHKSPGSKVSNKKNDRAEVAQNETYKILKSIFNQLPIKLVMVEGKLKGDVPEKDKEKIQEKIKDLKGLTEKSHENLTAKEKKRLEKNIKMKKRELSLSGAPISLWAEGEPLILVGSENKETLDLSREIVKEHLYLKDQLKQLGNSPISQKFSLGKSFDDQTLKKLQKLKQLKSKQLKSKSGGKSGIKGNPFSEITDKSQLKTMLKKNEEKINKTIVERRNKETAENFAESLENHDENIGIIQYGAGHKLGLVKELNKRGISVIVVTPQAVASF